MKVQTSVYLAQKMRSNSISTTASLDIAGRLGLPSRSNGNEAPIDRQNDISESIEFENGISQGRGKAELTIENVNQIDKQNRDGKELVMAKMRRH